MRSGRVTIRAKLYVAILLTVLGPVITIAVALHGMDRLGDRFDEVQDRSEQQALALELKFDVTDVNGWQTAYGYDDGASRPLFERSVRQFRADLGAARNELTDPRETRLLNEIRATFEDFMRLDAEAYAALRRGDDARVKEIFLGPELELFEAMAQRADELSRYEARGASATEREFDDSREDSRRGLIAVALGAALVIILLLVTASDIARMALESGREMRAPERERQ
jgi:methyl-accepting chemotaxis protein